MLKPIEVSIYVGDSVSVTITSSPPHPAITGSRCESPSTNYIKHQERLELESSTSELHGTVSDVEESQASGSASHYIPAYCCTTEYILWPKPLPQRKTSHL